MPGHLRWTVLLAALPLAAAAEAPNTVAVRSLVDSPVPLVLKDGRIARIGLYAVPFTTGSAEPVQQALEELDHLAANWATDCFLSAQVIGHVAPGSGRDGDTLAAHRLARARADRLQAVLIGHGLPENAIASVWDWQFFVPESRATLWVFELVPGEDCEGVALKSRKPHSSPNESQSETAHGPVAKLTTAGDTNGRPEEPPVATADAQAPLPVASDTASTAAQTASGSTQPPAMPEQNPEHLAAANPPSASSPAPATPEPVRRPTAETAESQTKALAQRAASGSSGLPSPNTEAVDPASETALPAAVAATASEGQLSDPASAPAAGSAEAVYEVQFDLNSSFLPQGAGAGLRAFLDRLGEGRFAIRLEGAVAGGDVANARTPEEARRYNEWITTRRVNRVREWLERHAAGRIATIEQELIQDDPSRRVVIRARRLP